MKQQNIVKFAKLFLGEKIINCKFHGIQKEVATKKGAACKKCEEIKKIIENNSCKVKN